DSMNDVDEASLREDIVAAMRAMDARGLNRGTSGNVSVRAGDAMLVTPSGIPPAQMHAGQIVRVAPDGSWRDAAGLGLRPSS
ncbi:class II aldolase/adducin family protein, partial [Listeria monocytogenes]|uniref:class II aldolase/adducin family protein n=1 Tax=Listeria monocytogenes TaxID=1639 RepID=UPI003FA49499